MTLPTFSYDQIAYQLTDLGHRFFGETRQKFVLGANRTLTYDISDLSAAGKMFARAAFDSWSLVSGIQFVASTNSADIVINHGSPGDGAFAFSTIDSLGNITRAEVTITEDWIANDWRRNPDGSVSVDYDSYSYTTYIHEIGHALGLAHAGDYNGDATYPKDAHYANDSWQASLMSYFSQTDNTTINASFANPITPMIADIIAIQDLYGRPSNAYAGDTVYGKGGNAGELWNQIDSFGAPVAFTIYDNSGIDTVDLSVFSANQKIDLNREAISDVGGLTGNMIIARDTDIENAISGSGNDHLIGNALANTLKSGGGDDTLDGGAGDDLLIDGVGKNTLTGGAGADKLISFAGLNTQSGGTQGDFLIGGMQADTLDGGAGNDVIRGDSSSVFLTGSDQITGGAGNDTLMGGGGADTFIFHTDAGDDVIGDFATAEVTFTSGAGYQVSTLSADFETGIDQIQLMAFGTVNASNVMSAISDTAQGARFDAEGTRILFHGISSSQLSADDFIFA
jgi:serralysin